MISENHSYFNLSGSKKNVLNHQLKINSHYFLPVDESILPTGEIRHVKNSPFDFRELSVIGERIHDFDQQLKIAGGYDHTWVLSKHGEEVSHAATLVDPASGRRMEVHTSEPGMQLYTGNFIEGIGKNKKVYGPFAGLCLETQHFPDAPNHGDFPTTELLPGERFESTTILVFSNEL